VLRVDGCTPTRTGLDSRSHPSRRQSSEPALGASSYPRTYALTHLTTALGYLRALGYFHFTQCVWGAADSSCRRFWELPPSALAPILSLPPSVCPRHLVRTGASALAHGVHPTRDVNHANQSTDMTTLGGSNLSSPSQAYQVARARALPIPGTLLSLALSPPLSASPFPSPIYPFHTLSPVPIPPHILDSAACAPAVQSRTPHLV
jgi:hypothetical protein